MHHLRKYLNHPKSEIEIGKHGKYGEIIKASACIKINGKVDDQFLVTETIMV